MIDPDISFECPHCQGPLITEASHAGVKTDCPHCFVEIEVPEGTPINKNKFIEPEGLRRTLRELRDREWEIHRRQLRLALKRNEELEDALARAPREPVIEDVLMLEEATALRAELAAALEELAATRSALAESREQHGVTLNTLRNERDAFREEFGSLSAALQRAEGEVVELRTSLHALRERLEEEAAKVFIMEAALSSDHSPLITDGDEVLSLKREIEEMRTQNHTLQQMWDCAKEELACTRPSRSEPAAERVNASRGSHASGFGETGLTTRRLS